MSKQPAPVQGAAKKLDDAIGVILQAKNLNDALQRQYAPDSAAWKQCDVIDDKLHDALVLLGS